MRTKERNWTLHTKCFSIAEKNVDKHIGFVTKMYNDFRGENPVSVETMKKIALSDSYIIWVVTSEDKEHKDLYGFLLFNKVNAPSYGEIELVYVDPQYRERNVGSELLYRVDKYCYRNNIDTQILYRDSTDQKLCSYYKKRGFYNAFEITDGMSVKMVKMTPKDRNL